MARRFILVAIAALGAVLLPASAYAAIGATQDTALSSPVHLSWDPGLVSEKVFRAPGACSSLPMSGEVAIVDSATLPLPVSADDAPGDGNWCYYVQSDGLAYTGNISVTIDTLPPTTSVAVAFTVGAFVRGAVTVTPTTSDATATTTVLRVGAGACNETSTAITSPWNTALAPTAAGGAFVVCSSATDAAGHLGVSAGVPVTVDNSLPTGGILAPAPAAIVGGAAVALTTTAADTFSGVASVQWQRSADGTTAWTNIGALVTNAAANFPQTWATAGAGDGDDYLRALVTDVAGNQGATPVIGVTVDNTPPNVRPVVTAPPAVAGSPTLSWTPAQDLHGISRYDVLRGTAVVGSVVTIPGAVNYSFSDRNAPDQATSTYVVRAYDVVNNFVNSDASSVLVDSTAQSAPRTLAAATPTASAPTLNWQPPAVFAVAHYDIYRDGLPLGSTQGALTTYTDSAAGEGVHDYAVLARDAANHPGVLSASFNVILDRTPPASGGVPTAQILPDGRVALNWPIATDALSGVSSYIVRRASGALPPAAPDGGTPVCAPTAAGCTDAVGSGTWSYGVFARDRAGNTALIGSVPSVVLLDKTAPLAPTKVKLTQIKSKSKSKLPATNITYTLRWTKPTDADLDRVLVVLNLQHAPKTPGDGRALYRGLGTSVKVKLRAGQTAYLALFAYDHSGNFSPKPARKVVNLAALIPLRPVTGSTVRTASPVLTWKAQKAAAYYNLQLFVNGKRVLVGWPSNARYRIPAGKLLAGTYVWYVWPAVTQKGGSPKFGKLIGRATFTYKK